MSITNSLRGTSAFLPSWLTNCSGNPKLNDVLDQIDANGQPLVWSAISQTVTDPSTLTPSSGDTYIVGGSAIGVWATHDDEQAVYNGASWDFTAAINNQIAYVLDVNEFYQYSGSAWTIFINLPEETVGADGWAEISETLTYASDTTYSNTNTTYSGTVTIVGDFTSVYSAGMKVKLTQTTAKYFGITAVSFGGGNTTLTLFGGTDYQLVNAAITSPNYSVAASPHGFPTSETKWTIETIDTANTALVSPTQSVWNNINSNSIDVALGNCKIEVSSYIGALDTSTGDLGFWITLSTANNTESDTQLTSAIRATYGSAATIRLRNLLSVQKRVVLSADDTYYLNVLTDIAAVANINVFGAEVPTIIRFIYQFS